ncbi:late embryogenesis abundant protein D-34-like [Panicum miliaceum]|uniref:Late embryogenesis abundant protein D-34-like n=1 Tax=Panicum miliaceum TaxID=4540 RepID=A0A3L6TSX2_PANMI|nr:late embryogenesis abundant protein D-34-like [Panicum miliaceum]
MSQGQPRRPQAQGEALPDQPIRYGDVFDVSGELAGRPVAPRDAALLQSAEQAVLGRTQKSGPAAVLESAAALSARAGHVGKGQITGPAADAGATVTEAELPGRRVVSESVGGQVVARLVTPAPVVLADPPGALDQDAVTIDRALEAVAATAEDKPDAREKLPADKGATAVDAERVVSAEIRNKPDMATTRSGVAEAVTAAARLNQERP